VAPKLVGGIWPLARDLIRSASLKTGRGSFEHTESEVLAGKQLLWLAADGSNIEAAATTQLVIQNGLKICVLVSCGGKDRKRWLPLLDGIEDYARKEGCDRMRLYGRKGWARVLNGYRQRAVILEKGLNDA
jgi:hypothetical protein